MIEGRDCCDADRLWRARRRGRDSSLDHSLSGVEQVLELEAALGVRSTWFVQVACDFYNLLSPSGREFLARFGPALQERDGSVGP